MKATKIYFRYGAMNAGKSLDLLRIAHNYEENGIEPLLMKSKIDDRVAGEIFSRVGVTKNAIEIDAETDFGGIISDGEEVILVDEANFMTKQEVDNLINTAYEKNVTAIMFFGLKVNIFGELFEGSKRILERADKIEESTSICWCGKKARQNVRVLNGEIVRSGPEILIEKPGQEVKYVTLCNYHAYRGEWE